MKDIRNLLLAATLAASSHVAMAQAKWDFPTGYSANSFHTENLAQFAADVEKAVDGKLKLQVHPGGSLYKANEIKRAIQTGQVQIGEFILSGASNENPIFGVDSIPFVATSYAEAKKLATVSRPTIEKILAAQGMKLLYTVPWPGQSLYSNKPVTSAADLRGTKMRSYNPATSRIAQLLGAQPATIQLSELGQALATGAVDNFLTSSASGIESKLYEHVKNFYAVNAWLPKNAVVVSQKAFDSVDKPTQDAILKAAATAEDRGWKRSEKLDQEYLKGLADNGMTVSTPSQKLRDELLAIGDTMTAEWLRTSGDEGKRIIDAYKK
ncbi:MAG: C4-dicarboxylate ABC transporter substrate-binding protein [Burkholderiales bacterium RIFCSPLOWO2_02_FULL_57_36]|nr:MAG: C4-dicarboxylate ABC transporter substrate-binding protein [Burkholderiales bacterium RIFCSPLOWO2_02_FULL_57_36]